MRWAAIAVSCPPAGEEAAAAALEQAGCAGAAITPTVEGGPVERPGLSVVTGYLPVDDRLERLLETLQQRLHDLAEWGVPVGDGSLSVRWVEEEDWAHAWKRFFRPLRVGRRFVVRPTWEEWVPEPGDRVIAIDPGMAFGTGTHPTTQLCLELIEEGVVGGASVLDVGTGSGILAIAAAVLGAAPITAIDIDPIAVSAAGENRRVNPDAGDILLAVGDAAAVRGRYDWVFANLIAEILRSDAALLASRVTPGGALLAAGIVAERAFEVRTALEAAGLQIECERCREEWVALVARRPGERRGAG
jgi:ribosomal protein L11 methyltransferase